jgi:hypothetical protein
MMNDISGGALPADASTSTAVAESEPVETPEGMDLPESGEQPVDREGAEGEEAEGEPKAEGDDKQVDARTNPAKIRAALKVLRDSDPANAGIARELNDAYGRYQGYKSVFPKVGDAQAAKITLDAAGGTEGIAHLQSLVANVNQTDANLYSGKGEVIDSLLEDMKSNGHPEALGKLAPHYLDVLEGHDKAAYETAMNPRHLSFLDSVNFPGIVNALAKAAQSGDTDTVSKIVAEMGRFYNDFRKDNEGKANVNPEKEAWEKERDESRSNETKTFQTGVATACVNENKSAILSSLKQYVKDNPYFKSWSQRMLANLGNDIHQELFRQLKGNAGYQSQMGALWSVGKPDGDKIKSYHKSVAALMAPRIVKEVLDKDYSGYAKRAVSKPPIPAAKNGKAPEAQVQTKPNFVFAEPAFADIDWGKDPARNLYTTNKAYLKSGKFVQWGANRGKK